MEKLTCPKRPHSLTGQRQWQIGRHLHSHQARGLHCVVYGAKHPAHTAEASLVKGIVTDTQLANIFVNLGFDSFCLEATNTLLS